MWAVFTLLGSVLLFVSIVFGVSSKYVRYDADVGGGQRIIVPMKVTQKPMPPTMKVPIRKPVLDKNGKIDGTEQIKVKGTLGESTLNFRFGVFNRFAGPWRAITTLIIIIAASVFGYLVSFILREPNIVLPVACLAALVDVWTVIAGPTAEFIKNAPHVVNAVSAAIPDIGGAAHDFAPISFIGPADFIFFSVFLGATARLKMAPDRTFWFAFPLLTIGMASVVESLFPIGLPALTLIGISVILANRKFFRLKKEEYVAIIVVGAILLTAMIAITPVVRRAGAQSSQPSVSQPSEAK